VFSVDRCHRYCVTRNMPAENQSSSECITSHSNSDNISLTSTEDSINANCCSAGTPLPFVHWEFCEANSTSCTNLTTATHSITELKLTGSDLPEGDSSVRCVAKYLDVTEYLWTISLNIPNDGKMWAMCGNIVNSQACFTLRENSPSYDYIFV